MGNRLHTYWRREGKLMELYSTGNLVPELEPVVMLREVDGGGLNEVVKWEEINDHYEKVSYIQAAKEIE